LAKAALKETWLNVIKAINRVRTVFLVNWACCSGFDMFIPGCRQA
jgi:hypothetical protein